MTEQYKIFEAELTGTDRGNPYEDIWLKATFSNDSEAFEVNGFYCGGGQYKIRFMPPKTGEWTATTRSNDSSLDQIPLHCACVPAGEENHGRVLLKSQVVPCGGEEDGFHFVYEDGVKFLPFGTTCYAWVNQPEEVQEQTLKTLKDSPFNKVRMCIFPKFYTYNTANPERYAFLGNEEEGFDFTRFNPVFWDNLERRIGQLDALGIEADVILFHPYDKWGLNEMGKDACDWYLKYVVARYGAFRNVWWSLSNEFDFIRIKTLEDWERYGQIVSTNDPFHRLLSVHNGGPNYDFSKDWVTHCSLQRVDFYRTTEDTDAFVEKYGKPVVWDEICYEGNIGLGWGNITAEELVRRFWEAFMRGGHCGHGETYMDPEDILWWSHGGILKGESPARLQFLLDILKDVPGGYLTKGEGLFDEVVGYAGGHTGEGMGTCYDYAIHYLGICRPTYRPVMLPEDADYEVDVIDTWNMTVESRGVMRGYHQIELPGRQYMAVRVRKVR